MRVAPSYSVNIKKSKFVELFLLLELQQFDGYFLVTHTYMHTHTHTHAPIYMEITVDLLVNGNSFIYLLKIKIQ